MRWFVGWLLLVVVSVVLVGCGESGHSSSSPSSYQQAATAPSSGPKYDQARVESIKAEIESIKFAISQEAANGEHAWQFRRKNLAEKEEELQKVLRGN